MSLLRPPRPVVEPMTSGALHELAQQKVQAALSGLSRTVTDQDELDPVLAQAVERMQTHLGDLTAVDQWGRPVTWSQVARIVIGPLAERMRDADTAGVLMDALTQPPLPPAIAAPPAPEPASEPVAAGPPPVSQAAPLPVTPAAPPPVDSAPPATVTPADPPPPADPVRSHHLTLEGGAHRYVFRAEERLDELSDPRHSLLDHDPGAQAREERLLAALERRYPDPSVDLRPRQGSRAAEGVGWPTG